MTKHSRRLFVAADSSTGLVLEPLNDAAHLHVALITTSTQTCLQLQLAYWCLVNSTCFASYTSSCALRSSCPPVLNTSSPCVVQAAVNSCLHLILQQELFMWDHARTSAILYFAETNRWKQVLKTEVFLLSEAFRLTLLTESQFHQVNFHCFNAVCKTLDLNRVKV